jgi:energy-converting hydrogenase Eha subunit B
MLVVCGLQASAGLVAALQWMVPLAVALLVGTLLWVGSRVHIDPGA